MKPPAAQATLATATAAPSPLYRRVTTVGELWLLSPDGTTLVSQEQMPKGRAFLFQSLDGTVLRRIEDDRPVGLMEWLPDSSGVFVHLEEGQRAGPLGILSVHGPILGTGLDAAYPALSPDGKWIAAEHEEGCCATIRIREIWIAPRSGGTPRKIAVSTAPSDAQQPIALLGWDRQSRLIYRDADRIMRVTLDGARSELPAPASVKGRWPVASAVSSDHSVILACAADPQSWWTIADGRVSELPRALRPAWRISDTWCSDPHDVPWYGPHDLILRDVAGELQTLDAVSGSVRPLVLMRSDALLSASSAIVLADRGDEAWLLSASGGGLPTGLRARRADLVAWPVAGGSFFVRAGGHGYLVGLGVPGSRSATWQPGPQLRFPPAKTTDNNVRCGLLADQLTRPGEGYGAYVISPVVSAAWGVGQQSLVGLPDQGAPAFGSYVCFRMRPAAPMAGFLGWVRPGDVDYVPRSDLVPTGFTLPQACQYVGPPRVDSQTDQVVWQLTCGAAADRDARGTLAPALTRQGWTACGSGFGVAIWTKDARTLTVAESLGDAGDHPTVSLRPNASCP